MKSLHVSSSVKIVTAASILLALGPSCLPDLKVTSAGEGGAIETTSTKEDPDADGCEPSTTKACYSGSNGTKNVGLCKGGLKTCAPDSTWGPCVGEVTPKAETCDTPGDDDCDGQANESGVGCLCEPKTATLCYDGPSGTVGMGPCTSGTQECNELGNGYEPCLGQIVPGIENCDTAFDEDCSGSECDGEAIWGKRFGDMAPQRVHAIAADGGGNIIVAGEFESSIDFGAGLQAAGGFDVYVTKMTPAGDVLWAKAFGDQDYQTVEAVTVDSQDNIILGGSFQGSIDFGGGPLTSIQSQDAYLAKLDKNGEHLWSRHFSGSGWDQRIARAVVGSGNQIVITGYADFGGGDDTLAKFSQDGTFLWSKGVGLGPGLALDQEGNIFVGGTFTGTFTYGGSSISSDTPQNDVALAKLDLWGNLIWLRKIGGQGPTWFYDLDVDPQGNVLVTGLFDGSVDCGGGSMSGTNDMFLAKIGSDGSSVWQKSFGGVEYDMGLDVAADLNGGVVLLGIHGGAINVGGPPLNPVGDLFLARYTSSGDHVWSKSIGGDGTFLWAKGVVSIDPGNRVVAACSSDETVDFGSGALGSMGKEDVMVGRLMP